MFYPDVVVLDLHLPDASAVQVCREIRSRNPRIRVLLLTSYGDDEAVIGAILGGAAGYLRKEVQSQDIVDAVRKVARGSAVGGLLDHGIRERVLERVRRGAQEGLGQLTRLEEEILGHVARGKTNSEVAAVVSLSEEVVRSSVSALLEKLEATRRSQAAAYLADAAQPFLGRVAAVPVVLPRKEPVRAAGLGLSPGRNTPDSVPAPCAPGHSRCYR